MPDSLKRVVLGFVVAAVSVLTFHATAWEAFHLFGLMPPPFPTRAVPPFGVPQIISLCFWGGVWGALFGLVLPTLPSSVPMWLKGLGLGIAAALLGMFIVAPLKGQPIAGGWQALSLARSFAINGFWGLGVGLMLPVVLPRRQTRLAW
jgi:hypothetical protein